MDTNHSFNMNTACYKRPSSNFVRGYFFTDAIMVVEWMTWMIGALHIWNVRVALSKGWSKYENSWLVFNPETRITNA